MPAWMTTQRGVVMMGLRRFKPDLKHAELGNRKVKISQCKESEPMQYVYFLTILNLFLADNFGIVYI